MSAPPPPSTISERWPVSPRYRLPAHPFLVEGAAAVTDTTVTRPAPVSLSLRRPRVLPFGGPPGGVGRTP